MKTANQDTGVIVYSKGEFLCGQCYTLCSWTQIFLTFELRFKGCIHKLLVQIITEKFGAEFWAQDVFHYEHTYPIPIKQPVSVCINLSCLIPGSANEQLNGRRNSSPKMLSGGFALKLSHVSHAACQEMSPQIG